MAFEPRRIGGAAIAGLLLLCTSPGMPAAQPQELWRASGLHEPESVLFDRERGLFYVSNVNGSPADKDGNGYIARLSRDGQIENARWVAGLDAPKGMALVGDRLYVADIDELVAIDVAAGEIVDRYPAAGAKFLNDVTADSSGRVFVSDMMTDTIHLLDQGEFEPWLEDAALMSPNGLLAEEGRLVVAAWGPMTESGEIEAPGHLEMVEYGSKTVRTIGDGTPVGNLDGVERTSGGAYLVTDWVAGALFRIEESGEARQLLDLNKGSADLEYLPDEGLALIPMMMDGTVVAYRID